MESIGVILLRSAYWLAGFWLVYYLFLRKESYFELNRWFLLSGLALSAFMPFYSVKYTVVEKIAKSIPADSIQQLGPNFHAVNQGLGWGFYDWFFVFYLIGVIAFLLLSGYRIYLLKKIEVKGDIEATDGVKLIKVDDNIAPFSFLDKIFISKHVQDNFDMHAILVHEKVHIVQKHWIDLFLLECLHSIQWFNPIMVLYKKAVRQNHEYLADKGTLESGINPLKYKVTLVNQMLDYNVFGITSSLYSFHTSKRITMMNNSNNSKTRRFRLLLIVPVVAIIILACAEPNKVDVPDVPNDLKKFKNENNKQSEVMATGNVINSKGDPLPGTVVFVKGGL